MTSKKPFDFAKYLLPFQGTTLPTIYQFCSIPDVTPEIIEDKVEDGPVIAPGQGAPCTSNEPVVTEGVFSVEIQRPRREGEEVPSIMRFMDAGGVTLVQEWSSCRMKREFKRRSLVEFDHNVGSGVKEVIPEEGPGSEYGAKAKEEKARLARQQKYRKKVIPKEDQPWLMKSTDKQGKTIRFRGSKVGGISDNAAYFLFVENKEEGKYEALAVSNWFDFKPIQRYISLNAEEAEERFKKRNETFNHYAIMTRKRLLTSEGSEKENEVGGKKPKTSSQDWGESSGEEQCKSRTRGKGQEKSGNVGDGEDEDEDSWKVDYISSSDTSSEDDENEAPETEREDFSGSDRDEEQGAEGN